MLRAEQSGQTGLLATLQSQLAVTATAVDQRPTTTQVATSIEAQVGPLAHRVEAAEQLTRQLQDHEQCKLNL